MAFYSDSFDEKASMTEVGSCFSEEKCSPSFEHEDDGDTNLRPDEWMIYITNGLSTSNSYVKIACPPIEDDGSTRGGDRLNKFRFRVNYALQRLCDGLMNREKHCAKGVRNRIELYWWKSEDDKSWTSLSPNIVKDSEVLKVSIMLLRYVKYGHLL